MSFFAIQPKQAFSPPKNILNLGPGSYQISNQKDKNKQQSYAPFGSLSRKLAKIKNHIQVGPGQYQIRSNICKPSITKYQNNNCIIIKINDQGWSQFKSNAPRFKTQNPTSNTVGPGQYQIQRKKVQSPKKKIKPRSLSNNQMHLKNYIESRKPTLFSDTVQYQKNQQPVKTKCKGVSWSLNKKQRFDPLLKQAFYEEHREQFIQKIKDQKKKTRSKSQSAVFASKSLKSQFQADIYQTNNPFKVQLRKMIKYKDDRPGPGSYNYHEIQQKRRYQYAKHQFFGSTVQRFRQIYKKPSQIGPGYYSPKASYQLKNYDQNIEITKDNSQVQQNRHSYIPNTADIPGPGQYSVDSKRKPKSSCKWVFGSKQPRFSEHSTIQQNQEQVDQNLKQRNLKRQKEYQLRKQYFKNRNQPIFASTSKRFQQPKTQTQFIELGYYDTSHTNIAQKLRKSTKKQCVGIKTQKHGQSHPFMSSVDRFLQKSSSHDETNSHQDCWCLVKSVQKQIYQHQSSAFSSKQKRTVVFDESNSRYTPAVGSYTRENSFIKSSFNSKFLKINETKTKKMKIWNSQRAKFSQNNLNESQRRMQQINLIKIN